MIPLLIACRQEDAGEQTITPGAELVTIPSPTSGNPDLSPEHLTTVTPSINRETTGASIADSETRIAQMPDMDSNDDQPLNSVEDPGLNSNPTIDTQTFEKPTAAACIVREDWFTYAVKAGDTLSQIARRASTTIDELVVANCLVDPNQLFAGQILYVPRAISMAPTLTPTPPSDHWIRHFDALYQVSFEHPAGWRDISDGLMVKLVGEDGFVQLAAIGAPYDLNVVTEDQANHKLQPYGASPIIEVFTLQDGREARLIFPSEGQPDTTLGQALLVTPYAEPIPVGDYRYNYLTLTADVEHIRQIAHSLELPPAPAEIGINEFDIEVEDLPSGGKRFVFKWDSFGANRGIIVSGTNRRFIPWWPVEAFGELTVDLNGTIFANPAMTLQLFNDVSGQETFERIQVTWPCAHDYFFSPAPEHCPREAPLVTTGAFQPFEHGFMIWVPQSGSAYPSIYAFQDTGRVLHYPDTWTEGEPEYDPDLVPPEGLYQPVRGFGKAWREFPWLIDELGWATSPESTFTVTYQGEIRESIPGVNYLTIPDGTILQMVHQEWHLFTPG